MKTIIKLLIAAAVLNASVRCGIVAWHYYQFKDATQEVVTFGGGKPVETVQNEILAAAAEMALPVQPDGVNVTRDGDRTTAAVKYSQQVEVFPRYKYGVDFEFTATATDAKASSVPGLTR